MVVLRATLQGECVPVPDYFIGRFFFNRRMSMCEARRRLRPGGGL